MDFSILIPVYNQSIERLCNTLHEQASRLSAKHQILFIDDCSDLSISYLNRKVNRLANVEYDVLSENIGRAAIRNKLVEMAKYEFCIIMDGDVSIVSDNYIEQYLNGAMDDTILVGGHIYQEKTPENKEYILHWKYGLTTESKTAKERQTKPYASFMTSNFACFKSTFEQIKFDESLKQYGHEDTLFGLQAEAKNIPIVHMDNPVRHDGLEKTSEFLRKQKLAVQNLKRLYKIPMFRAKLKKHVSLISASHWPLPEFFLQLFSNYVSKNLSSVEPKIWCLQWQKLLWWNEKNE